MKTLFRKLAPLAVTLGLAFATSAAYAGPITPFDLRDGTNNLVTGADALDWNAAGSGVAIGAGPFSATTLLPVGIQFNFLYQANLVAVTGGTAVGNFASDLDTTANGLAQGKKFEFTIVAKMREVVTSSSFLGAGNTKPHAEFGLAGGPDDNKIAIFYDSTPDSKTSDGTGFDDGVMVALLTIDSNGTSSGFTGEIINGQQRGNGTARIHASIGAGDFVNDAYLRGILDLIFDIDFESNLNYPATTSATTGFHMGGDSTLFPNHPVNSSGLPGSDIVFKVDGSNQFSTAVPEPGSMLLLGAGLLGIVGATRRRKAKQA
jgi:hypothetical protein